MGKLTCLLVFEDTKILWIGGQAGIAKIDLNSGVNIAGGIKTEAEVVGMSFFQGYVLVSLANAVIKIFSPDGNEEFSHGPTGDHTQTTAVECMMIPGATENEDCPVIICGQRDGYITVYDLPSFEARGSFCIETQKGAGKQGGYKGGGKQGPGSVKAICDCGGGMFTIGSESGDLSFWQWGDGENLGGGGANFDALNQGGAVPQGDFNNFGGLGGGQMDVGGGAFNGMGGGNGMGMGGNMGGGMDGGMMGGNMGGGMMGGGGFQGMGGGMGGGGFGDQDMDDL